MDQKELERQRDEASRKKLAEHLARMQKLGRVPTEEDDAEEERRFQNDWNRWKQQYAGRVVSVQVQTVDPDADYKLLGLTRKATDKDIRRTFHKLAQKAHPDHGGDPDKFHALMMAYQRLTGGK
ncbi:MAG TPA: DnaJ domain-containing protein [bacterium]